MSLVLTQFLRYCLVGAVGFGINSGILYLLTEFLHVWYMLSFFLGVAVAMSSNFLMNKYWTFKPPGESK